MYKARLFPAPSIHTAADQGNIPELQRLLNIGHDINQRADFDIDYPPLRGLTPLMTAARSDNPHATDTLRFLIKHGADPRQRSEQNINAAWYAAGAATPEQSTLPQTHPDRLERLRYLLDLGLNPRDHDRHAGSLLTTACSAGDPARVQLLVQRGADPNPTARIASLVPVDRSIPIHRYYAHKVLEDTPQSHLNHSALPIFCAAASDSAQCVQLLLNAGADPNTRNIDGDTALRQATSAAVSIALLQAGADATATDSNSKDTLDELLDTVAFDPIVHHDYETTARALVNAGVDPNRSPDDRTPRLWTAGFHLSTKAAQLLLDLGADPSITNANDSNPIDAACFWAVPRDKQPEAIKTRDTIRFFANIGTDLEATDQYGHTPLHTAADGDGSNPVAIHTLLQLGVNPDPTDNQGSTPLMHAARRCDPDAVRLLLDAGADPTRRNAENKSPLETAREHLQFLTNNETKERLQTYVDNEIDRNKRALRLMQPLAERTPDGIQGVIREWAELDNKDPATAYSTDREHIAAKHRARHQQDIRDAQAVIRLLEQATTNRNTP